MLQNVFDKGYSLAYISFINPGPYVTLNIQARLSGLRVM